MTIRMAHALVAHIWGTSIIATTGVITLAELIYSESKIEPNMSDIGLTAFF